MKKLKENFNEIIFVYYLFSFSLLARLIPNYSEISTYILILNVLIVLGISFLGNKLKIKYSFNELIVYIGLIFLFLIDYNFRFNIYTIQTYINLIIFAIIPIFLFLRIKNIESMKKVYSYFALIMLVLYCLDPFQQYKYTIDYMGFGYNVMIYVFLGLYIEARKKNIIFIVTSLIALLEILFFANKGALLASILFVVLYEFLVMSKKKDIKKIIILLFIIVFMFNVNNIIQTIYDYAVEHNIESYSIRTLYKMTTNLESGFAGRKEIWEHSGEIIEDSFMFGNGAGYYRSLNDIGSYTHNILYDLIIEYGIIICMMICIIISKGIIKIIKEKPENKIIGIIFLCMWFPKLFLSSNFQAEKGFWLFLIWSLVEFDNIWKKDYNELNRKEKVDLDKIDRDSI